MSTYISSDDAVQRAGSVAMFDLDDVMMVTHNVMAWLLCH